jgi:RNA polymerase sigma factor (sigma-70 family)
LSERISAELLGRLLDEQGGALALYAAQWTESADDCVQEALLKLADQAVAPADPVAWLFCVVRNLALNQFRAAQRRERREKLAERLLPRATESGGSGNANDEPSAAELAAAIDALPAQVKEVVIARIWGGLGFEQIAALAKCSTSTAHRRYEAGISALRATLKSSCPTN